MCIIYFSKALVCKSVKNFFVFIYFDANFTFIFCEIIEFVNLLFLMNYKKYKEKIIKNNNDFS